MNNRGLKSSNGIVSELIEVLKKVKRGAEIDSNVPKIDARVAGMNKRSAKKVIGGLWKIKRDLGDIKRGLGEL